MKNSLLCRVVAMLAVGVATSAMLACGDTDDKELGPRLRVEIDPLRADFGQVRLRSSFTFPIFVTNTGDLDTQITYRPDERNNLRLCDEATDRSSFCLSRVEGPIQPNAGFDLLAGEQTTLNVTFAPDRVGIDSATLVLDTCDAPDCSRTVPLRGTGFADPGEVSCLPTVVDFGDINPGSCRSQIVTCENVSSDPATIVDWGIAENASGEFEATLPQVHVLSTGETLEIEVDYCPSDIGRDEAMLEVETDRRGEFTTVQLTGAGGGANIDVLPFSLDFGLVSLIGPARRSVAIHNVGLAELVVTEIDVDTAGTGVFTTASALSVRIQPGDVHDITIEFLPTRSGPIESTILIRSTDQDEPEVEVRLVGEGIDLPSCQFQIDPTELRFGAVERGRTNSRAFEIQNTGTNDCLVSSARIVPGSDPQFSLPDADVRSLFIAPATSATIRVQYSPTTLGSHVGDVEFSISSTASPFGLVPIRGTAADGTLLIVPNTVDFGAVDVACTAPPREIQIHNTGSSAATVESLTTVGNPAFQIVSYPTPLPAMPVTIAPGAQADFEVGFQPAAASSFAGAVEVNAVVNGNPTRSFVSLQGTAGIDAIQVDQFVQIGSPQADLLFVVDHSLSMAAEHPVLSLIAEEFIQLALSQGIAFQIGVTTTDVDVEGGRLVHASTAGAFSGPLSQKIVTSTTLPSPEDALLENISARPLTADGASAESGLEAAYLALTAPNLFGHNAGFVRQSATLSLVFMTDADDQSPQPIDFYVNAFLAIKGFRNWQSFSASAISGDTPGGCSGPSANATASPRYFEVTQRTGGLALSICASDLAATAQALWLRLLGFETRFYLTNQPVISTIEVLVDGVRVPQVLPNGTPVWSYDFATNTVNFDRAHAPEPGADVRIEYTAECL